MISLRTYIPHHVEIIVLYFCSIVFVYSCSDDNTPIEAFTACEKHGNDILLQYLENDWTDSSLKEFIQGTWRLDRIETIRNDSVSTGTLSLERELRFNEEYVEVYEPFDQFLGTSEYSIVVSPSSPRLFLIEQATDINGRFFTLGTLYPCNSELVLYATDVDGGDWFYRRVD